MPSKQGAREGDRGPSGHSWPSGQVGKGPGCNPETAVLSTAAGRPGTAQGSRSRDRGGRGGLQGAGQGPGHGAWGSGQESTLQSREEALSPEVRDPRLAVGLARSKVTFQ